MSHCCEIAVCVSTERKAGKARASKTTTAEERAATTGGGVKRKRAAKVGRRPKTSESEPAAAAAEKNRIKRRKKSASATATTTSVRTGDMGHDDMGQDGGSYMGLDRVGRKKKKRGRKRKDAAAAVTTSVRAGSDIDVGQIDSKAWKDDNRRHTEDKGPDEVGMKKRGRKKKEAIAEAVVPVDADVIDESIGSRARPEELGKAGRRKMKKKKTAIAT